MSDGERFRNICLNLETTLIKIGQVPSTRSDLVGGEVPGILDDPPTTRCSADGPMNPPLSEERSEP